MGRSLISARATNGIFFNASMITILTNAGVLGLGLLTSVLLARWLEPTGRGEVAAAILWPMLLTSLGGFGINEAVLFHVAKSQEDLRFVSGTSIVLLTALSGGLMAIGYLAMPVALASQTAHTIEISRVFLLVIPISMISQCFMSLIQANADLLRYNTVRVVIPVGYLGGTVVLFLFGELGVVSVILLQLTLNVFVLVLSAIFCIKIWGLFRPLFSRFICRELFRYGIRVHLGTIAANSNSRLDQALLAGSVGANQMGLYMAAVGSTNLLQAVPLGLGTVAIPTIAKLRTQETQVQSLKRKMSVYWVAVIATAIPLAIGIPWLLPLVYGSEFRDAVVSAEVLLIAGVFIGAKQVLTAGARALGQPLLGSKSEAAGMFVSIPLLLTLVSAYGIKGAAIAAMVSAIVSCGLLVILLARCLDMDWWRFAIVNIEDTRLLLAQLKGIAAK